MKMYVVNWKCGTKSGNLYIIAKNMQQALNKAITDYWRTVDDIVSIKQVHQESGCSTSKPPITWLTCRTPDYNENDLESHRNGKF